jgi:hypothetical protein
MSHFLLPHFKMGKKTGSLESEKMGKMVQL